MVSTTRIKLTNANINGGTAVAINATNFSASFKRLGRTEPIVGQKVTGTDLFEIASGDIAGIENPVYTINFVINLDDFTPSTAHSTSGQSEMNIALLKEFYRSAAGQTTMVVYLGNPDDQTSWKNYDGSSDTIKINVQSISIQPRTNSYGRTILDVTMSVREVS